MVNECYLQDRAPVKRQTHLPDLQQRVHDSCLLIIHCCQIYTLVDRHIAINVYRKSDIQSDLLEEHNLFHSFQSDFHVPGKVMTFILRTTFLYH